jgi:hypothetical protein
MFDVSHQRLDGRAGALRHFAIPGHGLSAEDTADGLRSVLYVREDEGMVLYPPLEEIFWFYVAAALLSESHLLKFL